MKTLYLMIAGMLLCSVAAYAQDENKTVSKFDFIPGEKIIFYDDFTSGNVGDFPALWNTNSSGEIVTIAKYPGRWFQLAKGGFFIPGAKGTFTDNFTIEFDFVPITSNNSENMYGIDFFLVSGTLDNPNEGGAIPGKAGTKITAGFDQIDWTNYSQKDEGYKDHGNSAFQFKSGQKYHVAFWVQKQRLRMYADENKILDLPRGMIAGYSYNIFRMETTDEVSPIISNFRIAAGLPDMRNKLLNEGKLITYGIQFDVNSAQIKPESLATLKEIAQILTDNPTIKIKIIGYTDADGNDVVNLDLSKKRAASVKTELSHSFNIDITRMETDGMGKTQPIAPNDNAVNKAKNRRVEFIKL
ncbi:OmpA family protein [Mucilaginibacter sp.]|uniref:OmpA family protein n=1 Tax=Mucilaginibacter sp. TaxID=1882438 RepID=UPI00284F75D2|nr:OmpA family protein [Mucilaginibacter sp.]MDR3693732.1 OmpA family protein [Mucilaginibacter sp.]